MDLLAEVTKSNIDDYLDKYNVIVCRIRNSRLKAKQLAILEMIFAQFDNGITAIRNGPLGDIKGIVSFFCPKEKLDSFRERLFGIGYCYQFYLLDFENEAGESPADLRSINPLVWKGKKFSIEDLFTQDSSVYEDQSPHNRAFKITGHDGEIKTVSGYRGNGSELGRRSLSVEDARCMVNLSLPRQNKRMIDPFAGAGGIIYAYNYIAPDGAMTSIDIDPVLKPGLEFYGSAHHVMDSGAASFPADSFDSVITEVPFSPNARADIGKALAAVNACLSDDGVFVIMCEKNQTSGISDTMAGLGNCLLFSHEIDRKGTDVEISVWWKNKNAVSGMEDFIRALQTIY